MQKTRMKCIVRWPLWALAIAAIVTPLLAFAGQRPAPAAGSRYADPRLMPRKSTRATLAQPELDYLPEQLLVGFRPGVTPAMKAQAVTFLHARVMRDLGRIAAQQWKLPAGMTPNQGAARLAASPMGRVISYAEPNYIMDIAQNSEDTYLPDQWAMHNIAQTSFYGFAGLKDADIDALEAWNGGYAGDRAVKVAIVDTGADYTHPDLAGNLVQGYDFVNSDSDPTDDNGHGTHVAGIIGALGDNGTGVKGVCPLVSIMPVKGLDSGGSGDSATLAQAINYAASQGAQIINASWGSASESKTIKNAIAKFAGLFVAAAGNSGTDTPYYPAGSNLPNIIAVAATEDKDRIVGWSNFGSWVQIAAPGVDILSTYPMRWGGYAKMSGTSMAAPHVAGAAAQVIAAGLATDYPSLKSRLINAADTRIAPTDAEDMVTDYHRLPGIRLNLAKALGVAHDNIGGPGAPSAILASQDEGLDGGLWCTAAADGKFTLTWTAPGSPDGSPAYAYDVRGREVANQGDLLRDWDNTWSSWFVPRPNSPGTPESFTIEGWSPIPGRTYEFAVRALDAAGNVLTLQQPNVLSVQLPGSATWNTTVVAPYGLYWVAHAYDNDGNPAVAYEDEDPSHQGLNGKYVVIARRINGVWTYEDVPGTDGAHYEVGLGFGANGQPAVSWGRYASSGKGYAVYISQKQLDNTWKTWQVDYGQRDMLAFEPGSNNPATIYLPSTLHISFARIVNGSVVKEIVQRNAWGARYRRLAYSPSGEAAIAFSRDTDSDGKIDAVMVARKPAGGKWTIEVVESGVIGYGVYCDIAWNPVANTWAIVHGYGGQLRFLQRNANGTWSTPELFPGDQSSLAFRSDGTAVVAHLLNQFGRTDVAATTRATGGGWSLPDVVEYGDWTASYISPRAYRDGDVTMCRGGGNIAPDGSSRWGVKYSQRKP